MRFPSVLLLLAMTSALACPAHAQGISIQNGIIARAANSNPESEASDGTAFPAIQDWSSLKIRLERWGCYGSCPVYKVEIGGDGSVTYNGVDNVVVTGAHRSRISQAVLRDLVAQFRKADFFARDDEYSPAISARKAGRVAAVVLDASSRVVSISFDGRSKAVADTLGREAGMPAAVTDLQNAIDGAAGTGKWVEGNRDTIAALEAEGWDFRIPAGKHSMLFVTAAAMGNAALVRQLLDEGVAVRNVFGCAALRTAADQDDLKTAALLVDAHVPASAPELDQDGRYLPRCTPLNAAAQHGNPEMLRLILSLHPDIDQRGFKGKTPLIEAAENAIGAGGKERRDSEAAIRLLLAAGARAGLHDDEGSSALSLCHSDAEVVRILLAASATDIDARDWRGRTPLMNSFDPQVTAVLLAAGADPYLKDKDGKTALDYANSWNKTRPVLEHWLAEHPQK